VGSLQRHIPEDNNLHGHGLRSHKYRLLSHVTHERNWTVETVMLRAFKYSYLPKWASAVRKKYVGLYHENSGFVLK
jgi:hypothetical protein